MFPTWVTMNAVVQRIDRTANQREGLVVDLLLQRNEPLVRVSPFNPPFDVSELIPLRTFVEQWRPHRWIRRISGLQFNHRGRVFFRHFHDESTEVWEARNHEGIPPFWVEPDLLLVDLNTGVIAEIASVNLAQSLVTFTDSNRQAVLFQDLSRDYAPYQTPRIGSRWHLWTSPSATGTISRAPQGNFESGLITVAPDWIGSDWQGSGFTTAGFFERFNPSEVEVLVGSTSERRVLGSNPTPPWVVEGVPVWNPTLERCERILGVHQSGHRPYVTLDITPRVWIDDLVHEWAPLLPGGQPRRPRNFDPDVFPTPLDGTVWGFTIPVPAAVRVLRDNGSTLDVNLIGTRYKASVPIAAFTGATRLPFETLIGSPLGSFTEGATLASPDGVIFVESIQGNRVRLVSDVNLSTVTPASLLGHSPQNSPVDPDVFFAALRPTRVTRPTETAPMAVADEPEAPLEGQFWAWLGTPALLTVVQVRPGFVTVELLPSRRREDVPIHAFHHRAVQLRVRNRIAAADPDLRPGQFLAYQTNPIAVESVVNGELVLLSAEPLENENAEQLLQTPPQWRDPPTTLGYPQVVTDQVRGRTELHVTLDDAQPILDLSTEVEHVRSTLMQGLGVPQEYLEAPPSRPHPQRALTVISPTERRVLGTREIEVEFLANRAMIVGQSFTVGPLVEGVEPDVFIVLRVFDGTRVQARQATRVTDCSELRPNQSLSINGKLASIRRIGTLKKLVWIGPLEDHSQEWPVSYDTILENSTYLLYGADEAQKAIPPGGEWVRVHNSDSIPNRRCHVLSFDEERRTAHVKWVGVANHLPDEVIPLATLLANYRALTRGAFEEAKRILDAPGREMWSRLLDEDDL